MRALLVVASLVALPALAAAQTARPGVDCSLLTRTQAQGLPCANAPKPDATPADIDVSCDPLPDPYTEPEKVILCGRRRPIPADREPVFEVGRTYFLGYSQLKAVVIGLARDPQGIQVVTLSWLPESLTDGVLAVRTPATPGGRTNWVPVDR